MEYHCISADSHIDLNWLPHDLFVSNASQAMKDRVPYVTQGPNGPMWVTKSGLNLGFANGKGGMGGAAVSGGSENTTATLVLTSIGSPLRRNGLYRHCLTASVAAVSSSGCPLTAMTL